MAIGVAYRHGKYDTEQKGAGGENVSEGALRPESAPEPDCRVNQSRKDLLRTSPLKAASQRLGFTDVVCAKKRRKARPKPKATHLGLRSPSAPIPGYPTWANSAPRRHCPLRQNPRKATKTLFNPAERWIRAKFPGTPSDERPSVRAIPGRRGGSPLKRAFPMSTL